MAGRTYCGLCPQYRTDFSAALAKHRRSGAAVTVLVTPADEQEVEHMGVVQVGVHTMP